MSDTEYNEAMRARFSLGRIITCLMCGGKGYMTARGYDGVPRPVKCAGCNGSGVQTVREHG